MSNFEQSRVDAHEKASAEIYAALAKLKSAFTIIDGALPLGRSARVLNPRRRLLDGLKEGIVALEGCSDEYSKMIEAAAIEAAKA